MFSVSPAAEFTVGTEPKLAYRVFCNLGEQESEQFSRVDRQNRKKTKAHGLSIHMFVFNILHGRNI